MKNSLLLAATLASCLLVGAPQANAQFTFASDNAGNSAYGDGWTSGDNGGSGWNSWTLSTDASGATNFIGDPSVAGISTNVLGDVAFGMRATVANNYANISRDLTTGMGIGDSLNFDWGVNWDTDSASQFKGFTLRDGSTQLFNINMSNSTVVRVNDTDTGFQYGTSAMRVTVLRTTGGYSFSITSKSGGATFTTNISSTATINRFTAYAANNNGDINRNIYFDNFSNTNSGVFSTGGAVTNANTFSGSGALSLGNNTTLVLSGSGNNNYTGATTISNGSTLVFAGGGASTFASTISGGGNLVLSNGAGSLVLTNNNSGLTGSVRLLGGTLSITNNNGLGAGVLELGGLSSQAILSVGAGITRSQNILIQNNSTNSVINVAAASAFNSTGSLTQDGTPTTTTKFGKAGSGTLILAGASGNTFNGQIQIGDGTVIAGTSTALGTNASVGNRGIDLGLNITDASQANNVALLASNGVTVSQSVYVSPNTSSALRTIGLAGSGSATFNNEFYMDGTLTVDAGSSASDSVTMSGNILHVGGLSKTNAGILTLSGSASTFSGGVTLGQGTLRVGANSALGTGAFTINGGTFASDGSGARTITNAVTMGGNVQLGDATGTGALSLSNVNLAGTTRTFTVANNSTIAGVISNGSGTPGLTKAGSGTLLLAAANTYSGTTTVNAGVLAVTNGSAVSDTGVVSLADTAGAVFAVNGSETIGSLRGGGSTGGNVNIAGGQTLTVAETGAQTFAGLITNSGSLIKSGLGTMTLTANNSYSGATTVSGGRLVVNGSQSSSAVTVNSGASLGGSGTVGALTVSGLIAPGNSVGTLSAGNTILNGGGSLELEMFDWINTAGTGWDLLSVAGNLTLSNTAVSPFTINLVSLTNSTTPGLSVDWNPNASFTNTFLTYSSLSGNAFAANLFTVNTNSFLNPVNGTFSITNVSGGLALLYTTAFVPSSDYTWNAGSGLWGTAGNWTNASTPTNGARIIFAGSGGASTNSSTVSSIQGLTFTNGAGSYTVSGTALAVGSGGISNASSAAQTISNNLSLSAPASIIAAGGNVTLAGNLTNGGNAVTVGGAANTAIGGVISGSGSLTKSGAGSLTLSVSNTYSGNTTVAAGTIVAANNGALGATNGSTTVQDGASLELSGGITTAESISITGSGVGNAGALRGLGNGESTVSGNITLDGNARINVDAPTAAATVLTTWGTGNFTVDPDSTTIAYYSQSPTTLTMNGTASLGDTLGGLIASPLNWSAVRNFGLQLSVTGTNNALPFSLAFIDLALGEARTYTGSIFGIGATPAIAPLTLFSTGSGSMTNIGALQFSWDGGGAVNTTLASIVSLPTSGLTISGNISGGANVLTVGSAASGSSTVADGMRLTGVISGAGGTYNGTATSLVKDGGGVAYVSGNNTFTGDVRVLDGILNVLFGASTNALGVGSDIFLSSLGSLQLDNSVNVSSIQGAGEGDAGNVRFTRGAIMTVSGAGKSMTMAGNISGQGGVRVAGDNSTSLTLSGDNTFSGATAINAGTMVLAGAGGNQALRSTSGITIGGSGKLLLSTSNQVRDNASVTLSGGTIQRASGVSEVFGNLNLTTASFLDYGTGTTGTLRFGTYTPSSLLTVQNFLPGNKLQFGSTLTEAQLNNAALFSFSSLFTTGTEGGFFTITAIPEPSTYAAAAGLLAFMLWSFRRQRRKN